MGDTFRTVLILAALGPVGWGAATGERGLVVEKVNRRADGAIPQLEPGDLLLGWTQGASAGSLSAPFDLAAVEIEQSPRGQVIISGQRQGREMTWTYEPATWEIVTRPALAEPAPASANPAADARTLQTAADRLASADASVSSWLSYQAAEAFSRAADPAACDQAYRRALDGAGGNVQARAFLWRAWAAAWISRRNWAEAEKAYRESLALTSSHPELALTTATAIRGLGALAGRRGDFRAAAQYYSEALETRRKEAPASIDVARSLNDLGALAQDRNDVAECQRYYTEALSVAERAAPGSLDVARNLIGLGYIELYRDLARSEDYYQKALAIQERLAPDSLHVAQSLISLGMVRFNRGDLAHAEEFYRRALVIERQQAPRSKNAALCLFNLAQTVRDRGDLPHAEEYNLEALAIFDESSPNGLDVARVLTNLGLIAKDRGNLDAAEKYHRRSLEIKQKLVPGTLSTAVSLNNLGNLFHQRGDLENSAAYLREALAIYARLTPGSAGHSACLFSIGEVEFAANQLDKAEPYFRAAVAIDEKLAPGGKNHAASLEALGRVLRARGHMAEAEPFFKGAVDALEAQTARLGGTEELRAAFRARYGGYYREHMEALLADGKQEEAFHTLERSRARSFLAMLAERDAVFGSGIPANDKDALRQNASSYDRVQAQLSGLSTARDGERIGKLRVELERLTRERAELIEQVRVASPRLAAIRYPKPLDTPQAQDALDDGTVLLSYSAGARNTVLFALSKLKSRPSLESFTIAASTGELRSRIERLRQSLQSRGPAAELEFHREARSLYDLLIKPAEAAIDAGARVLVVADGPLHSLPFGALIRGNGQYLIQAKPIHSVLSMTTYEELLKRRAHPSEYRYDLAAFGDPHYPNPREGDATRSADRDAQSLWQRGFAPTPLPFSRSEAVGVAGLFPGRSLTFLGAAATEQQAKSFSAEARYLHFAVHGFIDEQFPLDSALVLSLPDQIKEGGDNGLLQAWEIFQGVRWNVELVVLSACRTALGRELDGEGLIGLARAIQYAGARSVVATLWNVDDRKTAALMKSFYRRLAAGDSKDEALRRAQLDFIRSPATARPSNWAAFVLNGDWR